MNINYEYYRIFYHVAKCKSFTQAAHVLLNSQPNITRSIKKLEQELGCALFTRSNRHVELTPEGEALYRHVAVAFEHLQAGEEEIAKGKGLDCGILRIAATEVALHTVLLPVLKEFRASYPGVHLKLINDSTPAAIADLRNGLADLAIVTTPAVIGSDLRKSALFSVREVPVCGWAYRAMTWHPISLAEMNRMPLISMGEHTGTYRFFTQVFADYDLVFEPDIEAATADQILPMVKADLGVGFVPEVFLKEETLGETVFAFDLQAQIPIRTVCVLMPAAQPSGPAARALEQALIRASKAYRND